jgi:hypothetical protein
MTTTAQKLQTIVDIKEDIKDAINTKGGTLTTETPFADYAPAILNIETGGGGLQLQELLDTYVVANGPNVTAGTFVDFIDGENARVRSDVYTLRQTIGVNDPSPRHFYKAVALDREKVFIIYRDFENNLFATARVIKFTTSGITVGAPTVFNQANSLHWDLTLFGTKTKEFGVNRVLVAYRDVGNNGFLTTNIITINDNGDIINVNAKTVIKQWNVVAIALQPVDNDRIVVVGSDFNSSNTLATVIIVKGDDIYVSNNDQNIGTLSGLNQLMVLGLTQFGEAKLYHTSNSGLATMLICQGANNVFAAGIQFPGQQQSFNDGGEGVGVNWHQLTKIRNNRALITYGLSNGETKARTIYTNVPISSGQGGDFTFELGNSTLVGTDIGFFGTTLLNYNEGENTARVLLNHGDPATGSRYDQALVSVDAKKFTLISSYFDLATTKKARIINVNGDNVTANLPAINLNAGATYQGKNIIEILELDKLVTPVQSQSFGNSQDRSKNQVFGLANTSGSQGQTVEVWRDQNAETLKPIGGVQSYPAKNYIRAGEFTRLEGEVTVAPPAAFSNSNVQKSAIAVLDRFRTITVYKDMNNSGHATAVVMQEIQDSMVPGTPIVFKAADVLTDNATDRLKTFGITRLDDTRVLVTYTVGTTAEAVILTSALNTTTISIGTPVTIDTDVNYVAIDKLDTDKVYLGYSRTTGSNRLAARILTISSTTITVGPINNLYDSNDLKSLSVAVIDNQRVGFSFIRESFRQGQSALTYVSGDTITIPGNIVGWGDNMDEVTTASFKGQNDGIALAFLEVNTNNDQ